MLSNIAPHGTGPTPKAAETGYIALNDDAIRNLDRILFGMIEDIRKIQAEKVSQQKQKAASAATLATNEKP